MSKKNRWQRKLATKTAQWQQVRIENITLDRLLQETRRIQHDTQRLQRQAQASAADLAQSNRAYEDAFARMAAVVGRECIAAGIAQSRLFPHYMPDYPGIEYFLPENLSPTFNFSPPFISENQIIVQRTSLMLRILRAHPLVVDALRNQVHFRASLGPHCAYRVYAISDAALVSMEADTLTELISAELAGLLVEQIKRVGC